MEVKLITGATAYEAGINTIKQIDVTDLDTVNLVVVPDAFSLQAENLIFDCLNIKSTFNIEVVGISRLASKILRGNNIPFNRISGLEEVFNIYKATKNCFDKLEYFSSCNVEICKKILQIIKQFKACKIKPQQIKAVNDEILDKKMHDLKLIYEEYEKLLGDKLDLSGLLEFFVEKAQKNIDLSNVRLFFVNFDSFTLEINNFICRLAKYVKSLCIGITKSLSQSNAYIYEDDIFKKTTALAKEYGIVVKKEVKPTTLKNEQKIMAENLFAFKIEKTENKSDFFFNVITKNRQDEVEFVAKYIKQKVFEGAKFKEFSVAVADKNYYEIIKDVFEKYEITCNYDDGSDLSQTILGRFILKILEIANTGFDRQVFEYLASSCLLGNEEKVISGVFHYDVESDDEFLERYPQYKNIISSIKNIAKCKKIKDYANEIKGIVSQVEKGYNSVLHILEKQKFYKKHSENSQSKELIVKTLEKLVSLGADEEFSLKNFQDLLILTFQSVKVETIPSYIDAVYVGDATDSYFEDVKTLFVLGATAGALPRTQKDIGLIDDDDIEKLRLNFALEPEIKVLNRRNRLKLFELLQHAKEKLIVCVPMSLDGRQTQKTEFVSNLQEMFGENIIRVSAFEDFDLGIENSEQNLKKLLFYVGCKDNLLSAYTNLKSKNKLPKEFESALNQTIKTSLPAEKKVDVSQKIGKSMISNNKISPSELESYFSCPFKHLVQYGFRIKPKENIQPNRRHFGIFQHLLLKTFVEENNNQIGGVNDSELEKFLQDNVQKIAMEVYDKKVLKEGYFLKYLKNESKIILKNAIKEQKISNFRPILLEEKINEPICQNINLVGSVDRVDQCGKYFRVIDYKTGNTGSVKTELFYGKKLQLFLYADAIGKKLGLECAGVYYFNCQTKYVNNKKVKPLFKGLTLQEVEVVENMDTQLTMPNQKSFILGVELKANPNLKKDEFIYKYGSFESSLTSSFDYAREISKIAIDEIKEGYIAFKPYKNLCTNCPYISICRHLGTDGYRKI